ncbi:carboxylesterase family protein [Nonomuraea endophytica]|uniref:Para-nitrobenzyl esterase n=1 Tax=Nonomuraea endophytica TaxID=714136 RepID=A0A7W8AEZ9_9ACTN|nr:carboxylesterase family protein [Nonomuraea endophytica]MBB5083568.1 para-nitrobenzyl esterase [Nonomuraea endophytica]
MAGDTIRKPANGHRGRKVQGAAVLASGLSAGLLCAFTIAVMPGLAAADDRTFVDAMQQTIIAIENPAFFLIFLGAPVFAAVALVQARRAASAKAAGWIVAGLVFYALTLLITFTVHVPLNYELRDAGDPSRIQDLAAVRDDFVTQWVTWDIVRTLTATAAFCSLIWALVLRGPAGPAERYDGPKADGSGHTRDRATRQRRWRVFAAVLPTAVVSTIVLPPTPPTMMVAADDGGGSADRVLTTGGWVKGEVTPTHRSFLGIPYASPPIGPLRWATPHAAKPWEGLRDATRPGPQCPQLSGSPEPAGSEDCLYVNVTTPREGTGKLPVLVFVYGGGLISGFGAAYDPERMVGREVIVVTFNYRLGALGFLRHPSLRDPYAGNFGLADQQAALRWVRKNVGAFGGDHRNVTLWGQSGGGYSVCAQLAAPAARGLFDKAIVQSAPCGNPMKTKQAADRHGRAFAAELGCANATTAEECLRAKPVRELVRRSDAEELFGRVGRHRADVSWFPVAGTPALPLQPLAAMRLGMAADVPLIHGGTKHELRSLVWMVYDRQGKPVTEAAYPQIVTRLFGQENATRILAHYPARAYPTPSLALATLLTDHGGVAGTCAQLPAIDAAARRAPVYAYEYAQPREPLQGFPFGASHGADLRFFLDNEQEGPPPTTPEEQAFAERLIGYWTAFARTGDPGPGWPAYRSGTSKALSIAMERTGPVNLARTHNCGLWRTMD